MLQPWAQPLMMDGRCTIAGTINSSVELLQYTYNMVASSLPMYTILIAAPRQVFKLELNIPTDELEALCATVGELDDDNAWTVDEHRAWFMSNVLAPRGL